MSATAQEVATQPELWRRAVEALAGAAGALPDQGERVAITGCGTSLYVARAAAALREERGLGETDAFAASEFPGARVYDRVIAISRSGTTSEVISLLERLGGEATTLITAVEASPAATLARRVVALAFADERSVVQTRFATSTLALLRAHVGDDLAPAIEQARAALAEAGADPLALEASNTVFLGHGWSVGVAEEAALKLQEGAGALTGAYPAMEYRHGPISIADEGTYVWVLGTPDASIADDVRSAGAAVRVAVDDPMAELVRVHRLTLALAERRGLDPDRPRHLTRSVVLTSKGADR